MPDNDLQALLRTGIQAARNGNKQVARHIFEQVLEQDDRNELAWLWMASVVDSVDERHICLRNVLEINPENTHAREALRKLGAQRARGEKPRPAMPAKRRAAPKVDDEIDLDARTAQKPRHEKSGVEPRSVARSRAAMEGAQQTAQPGRRRRLSVLLIVLAGALGIVAIVAAAAALLPSDVVEPEPTPPFVPPPVVGPPTQLVTIDPESLALVPTWTPPPTPTPPPSPTPPPTRTPLREYMIAFSALPDQQANESIFSIRADGDPATLRQLTPDGTREVAPAISPDGRRIAFVSDRTGSPELYVMDADGGNPVQLTSLAALALESPCWSPDGQQIVFSANPEGDHDLYVVRVDDPAQLVLLTQDQASDREPAWSPDGQTILFASDRRAPDHFQIYALPADCQGSAGACESLVTQLTRSQNDSMSPAWSPDGAHIVFVSNRVSRDDYDLYVMRADGLDARLVTLDQHGDYGSAALNPAWSRDGQWIAFASDRQGGRFQIFAMSPDGTTVSQITTPPGIALNVSWYP